MPQSSLEQASVTGFLIQWRDGDQDALNRLIPLVYNELRRLARSHLRRSNEPQTLQPTGLVHEVYLRLRRAKVEVESRAHFYALAAHVMRCILVDRTRRRYAAKRGSDQIRACALPLDGPSANGDVDVLLLNDALTALARIDPVKSQIVELRFFGGLTVEEVGDVLGLSARSVARQWAMAKAWLYGEIKRGGA
jgi:RNA polymerase sigma factor (TIGR02999 family)